MQEKGCFEMIPLRGWPQDSDSQTWPKNNKGQWMSETKNLDNRGEFDNFEKMNSCFLSAAHPYFDIL